MSLLELCGGVHYKYIFKVGKGGRKTMFLNRLFLKHSSLTEGRIYISTRPGKFQKGSGTLRKQKNNLMKSRTSIYLIVYSNTFQQYRQK